MVRACDAKREHYIGRRVTGMKVQGRRKRGRSKRRWLDRVRDDIKVKALSGEEVYNRAKWKRTSSHTSTALKSGTK